MHQSIGLLPPSVGEANKWHLPLPGGPRISRDGVASCSESLPSCAQRKPPGCCGGRAHMCCILSCSTLATPAGAQSQPAAHARQVTRARLSPVKSSMHHIRALKAESACRGGLERPSLIPTTSKRVRGRQVRPYYKISACTQHRKDCCTLSRLTHLPHHAPGGR